MSNRFIDPDARYSVLATYVLVYLLLCTPILIADLPALVDLPNHLARIHIATNMEAGSVIPGLYEYHWRLAPNLGFDVIVIGLATVLPLNWAAKGFLLLTFATMMVAVVLLRHSYQKRLDYWALLAAMGFYNGLLYWGMVAYLFGISCALIVYALWIREERKTPAALIGIASALLLTYFMHLYALGVCGLLVATTAVFRSWNSKTITPLASAMVVFAPVLLLFGWYLLNSPLPSNNLTAYGGLDIRFFGLMSPTWFDVPIFDGLIGMALLGILGLALLRSGLARESRAIVLVLIVMSLAAPATLMGVGFTHFRLPIVLLLVLVSATSFDSFSDSLRRLVSFVVVILLGLRLLTTAVLWHTKDVEYQELKQAFATIAPGSTMLTVVAGGVTQPLDYHAAAHAVIESDVFVPELFTGRGTLNATQTYRAIDPPDPSPVPLAVLDAARITPTEYYWNAWWTRFDHVLIIRRAAVDQLPEGLSPIATGSWFTLCEVVDGKP